MELQTKTTIDLLTEDCVQILKQKYIALDGNSQQVGENWRCSCENSEAGRGYLKTVLDGKYLDAVMDVWGDTPTVFPEESPALGEA